MRRSEWAWAIYQGAFFLGGATGPALVGAFLAARREVNAEALNPLYALDTAPFSDAFLVIVVALMLALVASLGLRSSIRGDKAIEQIREGEAK